MGEFFSIIVVEKGAAVNEKRNKEKVESKRIKYMLKWKFNDKKLHEEYRYRTKVYFCVHTTI